MSLAPHLHPKTYWEERCALLEESMTRVLNILDMCGSQQQRSMLDQHVRDWNLLIGDLAAKYQPPEQREAS
jgi:hypothetical protein